MSSRSNSDSEEEDVNEMLARIKKNLNNEDSDGDDSNDEDEDKDQEENSGKQSSDNDDQEKHEDNNNIKLENQKEEYDNEEELNEQQHDDKKADRLFEKQNNNNIDQEDDIETGLNVNDILKQNGIEVENEQTSPNLKQQNSKQEEQIQQQIVKVETLNIQSDGSSSPTKSPTKKQQSQVEKGSDSPTKGDGISKQQKENVFTVVRVDAEKKEEAIDHLLQDLENIKIKKALLEDPEIINFKIDSSPLEQTLEQVKKKYDENVGKYMVKQKAIFDRIKEINKRSVNVLDQVNTSNKTFLKKKVSDKEKYVKDIQKLQSESNKTKTFLIMMIQRLESIELEIDKFTDAKLKQINRKNEEQNNQQQANNEQQQNN